LWQLLGALADHPLKQTMLLALRTLTPGLGWKTYISVENGAFLEALRLVVVVDAEFLKQDLVLVSRDGTGQSLLGILSTHATFLNKGPERGIVEIIDVA
jgi:hypothetical protein